MTIKQYSPDREHSKLETIFLYSQNGCVLSDKHSWGDGQLVQCSLSLFTMSLRLFMMTTRMVMVSEGRCTLVRSLLPLAESLSECTAREFSDVYRTSSPPTPLGDCRGADTRWIQLKQAVVVGCIFGCVDMTGIVRCVCCV